MLGSDTANMSQRFTGKTVLVTGGNSGIGLTTAQAFASEGANVMIAARREVEGREVVERLRDFGMEASFVRADVTNDADVRSMVAHIEKTYGRLDVAFNNAGYGGMMVPCAEFEEDVWDATIAVNLKGVWLCMKHQINSMLKTGGGSVINNSSAAGLVGGPFTGVAYCASKHGVVGLTKAAAAEYAGQNIRINAICPGVVGTPMANESFEGSATEHPVAAKHPIGRIGAPEEIAASVLFLGSEASSFMVGTAIPVDGGLTLDT